MISQSAPSAIGIVAKDEFADARAAIEELTRCRDYEDWLDARWGLRIGLAMAGVNADMVVVDLASFLEWLDRTGKVADERALDVFASLAAPRRRAPTLPPICEVPDGSALLIRASGRFRARR